MQESREANFRFLDFHEDKETRSGKTKKFTYFMREHRSIVHCISLKIQETKEKRKDETKNIDIKRKFINDKKRKSLTVSVVFPLFWKRKEAS